MACDLAKFEALIGLPYVNGGRGPDCYDCYGLIRELLRRDGITVPDYKSPDDKRAVVAIFQGELRLWEETRLSPGVILLFRVPGNFHVGYYLGDDQFIHTWEKSGGITIEYMNEWLPRLKGAYRYVGK